MTAEKVRIVQDADAIYREEIANAGISQSIGQYFAALTNMRSVIIHHPINPINFINNPPHYFLQHLK